VEQGARFVGGYTVALMVLGFLLLSSVIMMVAIALHGEEEAWPLYMVASLELLLAVACLAVAAFRARGSVLGAPATTALSLVLALAFPYGTAVFLWWLLHVRKRERTPA